jgi:DNA modification methylase
VQVDQVSIDTLIPYSLNNVKHPEAQVDRIANSIREFGFTVPLLVGKDNVLIAGHGRLLAAKKLGLTDVPVIRREDMTKAQERAYRILDNKLTRDSEWDFDALSTEFEFLKEDGFDFVSWGMEDLIPKDFGEEATDDEYEAGPLDSIETLVKIGDLIELGDHRLYCGDSTNAEHVGELLDGKKPFIMVTDPPYGVEYDPEWRKEAGVNDSNRMGKVQNDGRVDWSETYRLFPGDVVYVWHASWFIPDVARNLDDSGYNRRALLIWKKQSLVLSRGHYHWQHEPCWYAVREGKTAKWCGDRSQSTIWDIARKDGTGDTVHGTQKPIECMARPIRNHGGQGDAVFDPFLGSGTTLIACEQLGRKCFGMELEPKYCQVIIDRFKAFCEKKQKPFKCRINGEAYVPININT